MIQFLHPLFLYGLFLLAIPVILHLFSFKRYKKVYFSNFNFLEALQQQKKNSSRLKNWLLLLLRLLILTSIVIAFATPYLRPGQQTTPATSQHEVILYVDNSFSMTNTGAQSSLLEEAKKYLFDIVNTYPPHTVFHLLTNEAPTDVRLSKEQTLQALSSLKTCPAAKMLSQVFKETSELSSAPSTTLFLVSDFQKKNCDFQNIPSDTTKETVFLMLKPENTDNVYIQNVEFEQAFHKKNQTEKLRISVVNSSNREVHHLPLTFSLNGKKKSIHQMDIPANGEKILEINYLNAEEGFYKGKIEITDFPVVFDNHFFFSYQVGGNTRILYLWQDEPNPFFGKLFSDSTAFSFTSAAVNQMPHQPLSHYNLIILDGIRQSSSGQESLWEEYLIQGGNLLVLPGLSSTENQNRFLSRIQAPRFGNQDTATFISRIETQASLFRDVFEQEETKAVLPRAKRFYPLLLSGQEEKLLQDKRDHTLLAAKVFGKGNIYVSAFSYSPENSDMVYHPLFVPLLLNMACNMNSALNSSYFLHSGKEVILNSTDYAENVPIKIRQEERQFEFIPEFRKNFSGDLILTNTGHIEDTGLYEVVQGEQLLGILAWNYDRQESQMEFSTEEELNQYFPQAKIKNIKTSRLDHNSELVKEIVLQDNNRYLTSWFLALALLLLLLEQWVWKKRLN